MEAAPLAAATSPRPREARYTPEGTVGAVQARRTARRRCTRATPLRAFSRKQKQFQRTAAIALVAHAAGSLPPLRARRLACTGLFDQPLARFRALLLGNQAQRL